MITYQPLEALIDNKLAAFAHADLVGETATHLIARLARCLATLLPLLQGITLPPHRALPGSAPNAHLGVSNCGFQDYLIMCKSNKLVLL